MIKGKRFFLSALLTSLCLLVVSSPFLCLGADQSEPPGRLSAVHGELRGGGNCVKCHTAEGEVGPSRCLACHGELAARVQAGTGYHRDKNEGCGVCHQEHQGESTSLIRWDVEAFDHSETGYVLSGAHETVKACNWCHRPALAPAREKSKSFLLRDSRCSACHPDVHRGYYPQCRDCHTTREWWVDIW
jgi:hypothetical protein